MTETKEAKSDGAGAESEEASALRVSEQEASIRD